MSNLQVEISSDLDFENLIANVLAEGEMVARISQEPGFDRLQIDIFPPLEAEKWEFSFEDFDKAIHLAKRRLQGVE